MTKLFENQRVLLGFFVLFITILLSMQFDDTPSSANNVEQWVNLTNQMFYGSHDFMFSYGPMYWIVGGTSSIYNKFTYIISRLYLTLNYSLFWTILSILLIKNKSYMWLAITYLLCLCTLKVNNTLALFLHTLTLNNALYLLPLVFIYFLEYSQDEPVKLNIICYFLLGLYIGFMFYIRFFFGFIGVVTISTYLFSKTIPHYKNLNLLLLFFLAVIVSYIINGLLIFHQIVNIVKYFIINNQLNFGNSVDMTLDISNTKLCFYLALVCYLCLGIYCLKYKRVLFTTVSILYLMFFKMGFSRTDHYVNYFIINILILGAVFYFKNSKLAIGLCIVFTISVLMILSHPFYIKLPISPILNFQIGYDKTYQQRMSNLYSMFNLSDNLIKKIGDSTVDIYPYNNEYAFANQLNYDYRPIIQNYMTLTTKLDKMNMEFFESSNKPEYVIWTGGIGCNNNSSCNVFDGFDNKYSLNEDPLTSSSILLNYHLTDCTKGKDNVPIALFKKNTTTTTYSAKLIGLQNMTFGVWYKTPKNNNYVIKLIPNFQLSLYGKIKNLLFRGNILYINYKFEDNSIKRYRLNIINSQSGVWINPYLQDFTFNRVKVSSIMFETKNDKYFLSNFKAKWISVPIRN